MAGERIVLAYSGGLATSVAIPWLAGQYGAEIVTVTLDLGQGQELADVRERALAAGALRAHVIDTRDEFARDYILPALQADATGERHDPLVTALGRPVIARHLVRVAGMEGATAIAHGCAGNDGDQARLEASIRALEPGMTVLAPARSWDLTPAGTVAYAKQRNIPVPPPLASPHREDRNIWGRTVDVGGSGDPWRPPPEEIYTLTRPGTQCPDAPATVEIDFEQGVPVSVNGVPMPFGELIASLETIAGAHGVGRTEVIEPPFPGAGSRRICEAPAACVLQLAHRELQAMTIPGDLERLTHRLARTYADLVHDGRWFTPTREAIDALVAHVQRHVTGRVRVRLFKGACSVAGRTHSRAGSGSDPGVGTEPGEVKVVSR